MLKALMKRAIHGAGWDLHRLSPRANPAFQLLKCLERAEANVVFDIGANVGQFAHELRAVGYDGTIVSFEPQTAAHRALETAARRDRSWHIHPRVAIGDYDGETQINVAGNSVSSSVLPILDAHTTAAANSQFVAAEPVRIARLDSVVSRYLDAPSRHFLKIDTQGFEWQVLDGAAATLQRAQGVLCELSLVPLYEGQRLWRDIIDRLEAEGFALWAIQQGFTDPRDGRSLQVDGIFLRAQS